MNKSSNQVDTQCRSPLAGITHPAVTGFAFGLFSLVATFLTAGLVFSRPVNDPDQTTLMVFVVFAAMCLGVLAGQVGRRFLLVRFINTALLGGCLVIAASLAVNALNTSDPLVYRASRMILIYGFVAAGIIAMFCAAAAALIMKLAGKTQ